MTTEAQAIHTDRLDLLPLLVEHAEEMAAALSDPALHTFIGGEPADPQALAARYERLVAGSPDPKVSWCNWVIRLRDEACLTGTVQATISECTAEIAWVVGTFQVAAAGGHPSGTAGLTPTGVEHDGEIRWQLTESR